jgi:hypothetical protein
MGGTHHYEVLLGPVEAADAEVRFRLYCSSPSRETHGAYCSEDERMVRVEPAPPVNGKVAHRSYRTAPAAFEALYAADLGHDPIFDAQPLRAGAHTHRIPRSAWLGRTLHRCFRRIEHGAGDSKVNAV